MQPAFEREIGVTGLDVTAGYVRADPDYKLQGTQGIEQYDLMRHTDSTVSSVVTALSLPVREASWRVNPASSAGPDIEAAEHVESCMHDMSFSWDDFLTEVCTMFPFGWAWLEWTLKRRMGPNPRGGKAASEYSDGRVGFKKIALRAQTSLFNWDVDDDTGKLYGMVQMTPKKTVTIPLSKSFLFRTTKELNNPEGFSVLRPSHRPWTYKKTIERIEAIGIQRAMQGLPVVKLIAGATREGSGVTGTSTEERARAIIQHLYDNTMLGVIEDEDMEFRFEAPDMRGIAQDSGRVIQRYDEAIARSTLAMYILLGSRERGSYALAKELGDLFFLSVQGFIDSISQTFSQWAVPVLFRYNAFPGITGYPEVTTSVNRRIDLAALADFVNKSVGSMVITPDPELERHLRELADFPPQAIQLTEAQEAVTPAAGEPSEEQAGPPTEGGQTEQSGRETSSRNLAEHFAAGRSLETFNGATDTYKAELRAMYEGWIEEAGQAIKERYDSAGLGVLWATLIAAGLAAMKRKGWEALPEAAAIGYGSRALSKKARDALGREIESNDKYLEENLWVRVGRSLSNQELEEVHRLYRAGQDREAMDLLAGALLAIRANVGQYSGAYWRTIWVGAVVAHEEAEQIVPVPGAPPEIDIVPVRWNLDSLAEHCATCLVFGGREYVSMDDLLVTTGGVLPGQGTECSGNCRCWLTAMRGGMWVLL